MRINLFYLIPILLASCSSQIYDANIPLYSVDVNQRSEASEFFDSYYYVMLENNDSVLIGNINRLEVNDEIIAVQSRECIYTFAYDGKCVGIIDKRGHGEGEYIKITDFHIANNEIWVLSSIDKKLCVYDIRGHFKRDLRLDNQYYYFTFFSPESILLSSANCNDKKKNFVLIDTENGKETTSFDDFDSNESVALYDVSSTILGKGPDNGFYVTHQFDPSIYILTKDSFEKAICLEFNSQQQLPATYKNDSFYNLMNISDNKPMVRYLSTFNSFRDFEIITFPLFGEYGILQYMVKFKDGKQIANIPIFEKIDKAYPYLGDPLNEHDGYFVSALTAREINYIETNNGLSNFKDLGLKDSDNPVIFFHRLK